MKGFLSYIHHKISKEVMNADVSSVFIDLLEILEIFSSSIFYSTWVTGEKKGAAWTGHKGTCKQPFTPTREPEVSINLVFMC